MSDDRVHAGRSVVHQSAADDGGPMITAMFADGPLSGTTTSVRAVEGRPPKTLDRDGPGDCRNRYCLADWEQAGHSAVYTFLYEV